MMRLCDDKRCDLMLFIQTYHYSHMIGLIDSWKVLLNSVNVNKYMSWTPVDLGFQKYYSTVDVLITFLINEAGIYNTSQYFVFVNAFSIESYGFLSSKFE